jgi:type II secretory pathway pseudopilin PulG
MTPAAPLFPSFAPGAPVRGSSRPRSSFILHHSSFSSRNRAYTLVELFLTLAVLMIVLGLMMNLSNRVRRESCDRLTRQVLARLTALMGEYQKTYNALPPVQPLLQSGPPPAEPALQLLAGQNNQQFVQYLNLIPLAHAHAAEDAPLAESFGQSAASTGLLQDPWGSPIVFMPQQNPAIGMAPGDASFFFSAGPDRMYLTREDNVYSYEGSSER